MAWTGGGEWAARASTACLWGFLVIWTVAAADIVTGSGSNASTAAPQVVNVVRDATEQSTGAVASGYVAAWLSASKTDSAELSRYVSTRA